MAQVKKTDLFQNNIFGALKKQAKETSDVLEKMDKAVTDLSEQFLVLDKNINRLDSKTIKSINEAFQNSVKLRESAITIEKETLKQKKLLEQAKREEIKTAQQQLRLSEQKARAKAREERESEKLRRAEEKQVKSNKLLNDAYVKLNKQRTEAQNRLKTLAAQLGTNNSQTIRARKEFEKLDERWRKINTLAKDGRGDVGRYGLALGNLGSTFSRVAGAFGIVTGIQLFARGLKDVVNVTKEFELENSRLAALLNTNKENISDLTENAKELGATTSKTASEVVALQQAYARLGFSQSQILDLTKPTINGSVALNASLDETAELTGAVIKTFDELSTTDAGKVLDQLTASTQRSALNFQKLQTSLPIVAGAANAAGIPLNKLLALLGKLSDAGIDASSSATALKNIFIESADQGLSYDKILEKISKNTDQLTASNDEFGIRAAVSGAILAKNLETTNDLADSLENVDGAAEKFANITLDTLDGKLQLLNSAWEGFILSVTEGEGIFNKFSKTSIEWATTFLNNLSIIDLQLKVLANGFINLNKLDFKNFIRFFTLESGENISEFLDRSGFSMENLKKKFSELKTEFGEKNGIPYFLSVEAQYRLLADKLIPKLANSLIKEGESRENAYNFAEKYVKLLIEEAKNKKKVTKATEETTESLDEEKRRLGRIEELRKKISEQTKKRDEGRFSDEQIKKYNLSIQKLREELERLLSLGKEQPEEEDDILERRLAARRKLVQTQLDIAAETIDIDQKTLEETLKNIDLREEAEIKAITNSYAVESDIAKKTIEDKSILKDTLERLELEKNNEIRKITDKAKKDRKDANNEELKKQKEFNDLLLQTTIKSLDKLSQARLNKSLESIDKQLDGIENRSNSLSIQAANGNRDAVASLKDLEEREIELERKREQALQRRKRDETILAGLKIAAANAESTASPDLKALQVIAGVIDNIPSFFVGTERTGRGDLDNKGGFNAILHPDEKVFNHKDARKIGFNHDNSFVADTFYKYRTGQLVEKNNAINLVTTTDKRLLKAIEKNNDLLEKLPSKLPTQTAQYDEIRKEMRDVVQQGLKRTVKVSKGGVFS